jgi:hypothetical protein
MGREPEDFQERAGPSIRGAGLVEVGGKLFDAEPVGLGGRASRADFQVVPQVLRAPAVFSPFRLSVAPRPIEVCLQRASPLGQLLVTPREIVSISISLG